MNADTRGLGAMHSLDFVLAFIRAYLRWSAAKYLFLTPRLCGKISTVNKELDLWNFVRDGLLKNQPVMLLVVAESSGSSPGRQGYKMAVGADGELCGSIGGGVMEVQLADAAKWKIENGNWKIDTEIVRQIHRKNVSNSSGMICSGEQTVIVKHLSPDDLETVLQIVVILNNREPRAFEISHSSFQVTEKTQDSSSFYFSKVSDTEFIYEERLGHKHNLFIIGGGHCSLALSELMSKLGFYIRLFDDRPELNTLEKNRFANEITIIDSYENIANFVLSGDENYVVVMTIGYKFDEIVIRKLFDKEFKYFGVLGSKAKMKTLLKSLEKKGFDSAKLDQIHTPIGLAINSRTPEEIAVSIVAEIISVKNS